MKPTLASNENWIPEIVMWFLKTLGEIIIGIVSRRFFKKKVKKATNSNNIGKLKNELFYVS